MHKKNQFVWYNVKCTVYVQGYGNIHTHVHVHVYMCTCTLNALIAKECPKKDLNENACMS